MGLKISVPRGEIEAFCRRHRIGRLSLFGSVLRDDFGPDSDVDVLVDFDRGVDLGLREIVSMELELSEILGRKADLVDREEVRRSGNYLRRRHILSTAETVYVAG
ncbi:MAG: nucleotidyltransferase domain-containing protein [Planctomycetota bacterium]|nr:nucleotidyltransferase domain-containing protein [Planctomycetota bacterium]